MRADLESRMRGKLTQGRLEVIQIVDGWPHVLIDHYNSITDAAEDVVKGLLNRDFENKMIDVIAVGKGGDSEINPPHNDTGARVPPDPSETEIRDLVEALPILISEEVIGGIRYSGIAQLHQANSDDINEFAILTKDETMVAHFVAEEVAPLGRATKYPKTTIMYLIIRWTLLYTGS